METLVVLGFLGVLGAAFFWPHLRSRLPSVKRDIFLKEMEQSEILENRERALAIRQRDNEIKFRLIEGKQAADILSDKAIRARLEKADVDVERLKYLLISEEEVTKLLEE